MNRTDEPDIKQMILYEDRDILVCHKAAGLPVQSAGVGTKDLESILKNYLKEKQQAEQGNKTGEDRSVRADVQKVPYLGIIHRLDQPVEGVLVFAKNKKAAAGLSRQMSGGMWKKEYLAVCCVDNVSESGDNVRNLSGGSGAWAGSVSAGTSESGSEEKVKKNDEESSVQKREIRLTDWMRKEARINTSAIVSQDTPGAKKAELDYCVLQRRTVRGKEYVLVRIHLLTGRHHQIRVQMANAGLPLYGDRKYNVRWQEYRIPEYDSQAGTGLKLCASKLAFKHPGTGKEMQFEITPLFAENFLKLCID